MIARYLFRLLVFGLFVVIAVILWIGCGWMPRDGED